MEPIPPREREQVRELAKKVMELACSPSMLEKSERWTRHNAGQPTEPLIYWEAVGLLDDCLPPPACQHPLAAMVERHMVECIAHAEEIRDDYVVPAVCPVPFFPGAGHINLAIPRRTAADSQGRHLGYTQDHPIKDLARDWPGFAPAPRRPAGEVMDAARRQAAEIDDLLGGIMPAIPQNHSLIWSLGLTGHLVGLMGMEAMFVALIETPDLLRKALSDLVDIMLEALHEQEREGVLTLNNRHQYAGSGSLGWSDQLPSAGFRPDRVRLRDLWGNLNSQETVGVDPSAFEEHFLPHYRRLAEPFGLVYWGCCEPVHALWNHGLRDLPGLRKVSISPWCDEAFMGEALRGSGQVYARKPSPNFVGVGPYHEDKFEDHLRATMVAARGCALEISFRDIQTLCGDPSRARRAVEATRRMAAKHWR